MTGRQLFEKVETFFVVTIITILIWLYADEKNVVERNMEIEVVFVDPTGRPVAITPIGQVSVEATIRASTSQNEALNEMRKAGPIKIEIEQKAGNPEQVIILRDALNSSAVGALGVSVEETIPETQAVSIQSLETVELPVDVDYGDAAMASEPTAEPGRVNIILPANLASRVGGQSISASLDPASLARREPNVPYSEDVPIQIPTSLQGPWSTLSPNEVRVTYTLRELNASTSIPSVVLHINAPPLLLNRYAIELAPGQLVIRDVELVGPAEIIEQINTKEIKVWAEIRPTIEELESEVDSLPVYMVVPDGVTVNSPPQQVNFTFKTLEAEPVTP